MMMLNKASDAKVLWAPAFRKLLRHAYYACHLTGWLVLAASGTAQPLCSNSLVRVSAENLGSQIDFHIENLETAEVTTSIELVSINMRSTVPLPCTRTLAGKQKVKVFSLWPADPARAWSYKFDYSASFGNPLAKHNDNARYELPYARGKSFRVIQGYQGKVSHYGESAYAIDWAMPVGTPVHAAREGVVAACKADSSQGGPDRKFLQCANFVMVRHPDGTIGNYVHLKEGGVAVRVGQFIKTGDLVGFSGNTGYSRGPHLHFEVFKGKDGKERESIPVKFNTDRREGIVLQRGASYGHPRSDGS